jgi:myo-inositol-1(or 4)-monophosphatase
MNLEKIETEVTAVCREVGEFIAREGASFDLNRIEQKQVFNNLVSYVDKEAEKSLVKTLSRLVPAAGFITEEGTVEQTEKREYNWIVDPLDGTTNFLHGIPLYAISIGLTRNDKVVLGVVYDICQKESYHAIENGPAFCNNKEIKVSSVNSLRESLLATGFPYYHFDKREVYLDIIKEFLNETHGIRRFGSAAIDLAYVACGRLEGFFEYNLNPWDVAAGTLIVQQAGGKVTDFRGGADFLFGNQLCASNTNVHAEMVQIVESRWFNEAL